MQKQITKDNTQTIGKSKRIIRHLTIIAVFLAMVAIFTIFSLANAQTNAEELGAKIEDKETEITSIKNKIEEYKDQIKKYEGQQTSLKTDLAILENKVKKTELDIKETQLSIDKTSLELKKIDGEIKETEKKLETSKEMIEIVLVELYAYDEAGTLEVVFGNEAFSDFFDQIQYLQTLQDDLNTTVTTVLEMQESLSSQKTLQQNKKDRLTGLREELQESKRHLEDEQVAKDVLLKQAEQSETKYKTIIQELRGEQQFIRGEIFRIQDRIQKLIDEDGDQNAKELLGPTVLSMPVKNPVITAIFHDPTYPFRHLFEHTGVDMAVPQGTTVRAAAPGYVAWTKRGSRGYGNYLMIIHANGIATLYAHLSEINVTADQYIERGQPVAKSGGIPGTPGAGFSTGAHLHFEVRKDGIPVDPYNYIK